MPIENLQLVPTRWLFMLRNDSACGHEVPGPLIEYYPNSQWAWLLAIIFVQRRQGCAVLAAASTELFLASNLGSHDCDCGLRQYTIIELEWEMWHNRGEGLTTGNTRRNPTNGPIHGVSLTQINPSVWVNLPTSTVYCTYNLYSIWP